MTSLPESRSHDPLYRYEPLTHVVRLAILGVPVRFTANVPEACDSVLDAFGMWSAMESYPALVAEDELSVRIIVHDGEEEAGNAALVRHRMPDGERVIVHTPGSVGIADTRRGDVVFYVTRSVLADGASFRTGMLEGLTLVIVTQRDRIPIHGSMITRDGVTLLLAGPSGSGKSTLAYQAVRAGWTLLADDAVYVQSTPSRRLWGTPRRLYLSADAGDWFAEFAAEQPRRLPSGKLKFSVPYAYDWSALGPPTVERATVCLLDRVDNGPARRSPIDTDSLARILISDLEQTSDLYGDAPSRVIPEVIGSGGWRLSLTDRPPDAIALLEELARTI